MIILGSFPIFWSSFRLFPQVETGEVKKEVLNSTGWQLQPLITSHTVTNFIDHEISQASATNLQAANTTIRTANTERRMFMHTGRRARKAGVDRVGRLTQVGSHSVHVRVVPLAGHRVRVAVTVR